jgi:hypothetical protein
MWYVVASGGLTTGRHHAFDQGMMLQANIIA